MYHEENNGVESTMQKFFTTLRHIPTRLTVLGTLAVLFSLALLPASAMAAPSATAPQKCGATDVKCVITFGDQRIKDRQDALNTLSSKVKTQREKNHITEDQAEALQTDIKTNLDGLADLKSKLDGEQDAQAARTDIKNVYSTLRIFAVVLPRDYRRLHLDLEINLRDKLADRQARIERLIDKASSDKQTQLKQLFADYKTQLSGSEGQIDTVQTTLPKLTPASYNNDRTTYDANLAQVKQSEDALQKSLKQAASDLHQIMQLLKKKA